MVESKISHDEEVDLLPTVSVAVVVPLFPVLPGLAESLASLAVQTRPPDLVVLLDNGQSTEAESLAQLLPAQQVEIVQVEPGPLPAALNAVLDYLQNYDFVGFLLAGDKYAPERIARCLEALQPGEEARPPVMAVTDFHPVDGRGQPLPDDDPRVVHHERLWAPGRGGAGQAEWLGAGHFTATASNIFARRDHLAAAPLQETGSHFAHAAATMAGMQGLLIVLHERLLDHYPPPVESHPNPRAMAEILRSESALLLALRDRLAISPETRRNFAAYHRTAWNSLSGVREDLFQQLVLRLASTAESEEALGAVTEIFRSVEAQHAPAHWEALQNGADPLDLAGYADALRRTREQLAAVRAENARLQEITGAAQASGWVQLGAWMGARSARRIMEVERDEEESSDGQPPDGEVQSRGEGHPKPIGQQ